MTGIIRGEALTPQPRPPQGEQVNVEALRLLDELCQDSLDVPLSHVDGLPEGEYEISHKFRQLRDLILALQAELEAAREENAKLARLAYDGALRLDAAREREKGLRELLTDWLITYGDPKFMHGLSERTRRALAASPPNEPRGEE